MMTFAAVVLLAGAACLPPMAVSLLVLLFRRSSRGAKIAAYGSSAVFCVCLLVVTGLVAAEAYKIAGASQKRGAEQASATADEPGPTPTPASGPSSAGEPGRLRVCLSSLDTPFRQASEIVLPASTVFQDVGLLAGEPEKYRSWRTKEGSRGNGRILVTLDEMRLTSESRCAEPRAMILAETLKGQDTLAVAERRLLAMSDVLYYPIPPVRPAVEISKLIDQGSVTAIVIEDVAGIKLRPSSMESRQELLFKCRAEAKLLSQYMGAYVDRHMNDGVLITRSTPGEVTYKCRQTATRAPSVTVRWEKQSRPPKATLDLIADAGEHVLGVPPEEMLREMDGCVSESIRTRRQQVRRDFRGAEIECQAGDLQGDGGSVAMSRRFGRAGSLEN